MAFQIANLFKSQHASGTYWPELDGIRTLAFLLVFVGHMGVYPISCFSSFEPVAKVYNAVALWGWMGVELFFVLSAFLITTLLFRERKNYKDISFKLFFLRRMFRIWPLYYLVLILGFFVLPLFSWLGVSFGSSAWQKMIDTHLLTFFAFVANFQFANLTRMVTPLFCPLWSINVEEQFYVTWGIILKFIKNTKILLGISFSLLAMTITLRYFIQQHSSNYMPYYYNSFSHLDPLILGITVAFLWENYSQVIKKLANALLLTSLIIFVNIIAFLPDIQKNAPSFVFAMTAISVGFGLFLLSILGGSIAKRFFSLKPLVAIGRITYGMYIFHYAVLMTYLYIVQKYYRYSDPSNIWIMKFITVLGTTFLLAMITWNFYEKPFNRLRGRFLRSSVPSKNMNDVAELTNEVTYS